MNNLGGTDVPAEVPLAADSLTSLALIAVPAGFASSFLAYFSLTLLNRMRTAGRRVENEIRLHEGSFYFEGRCLLDADGAAVSHLDGCSRDTDDWGRFIELYGTYFEPVSASMQSPSSLEQGEYVSGKEHAILRVSQHNSITRLQIIATGPAREVVRGQGDSARHDNREIDTLRATVNGVPFPVWRQADDGAIEWVNNTYLDTVARAQPGKDTSLWPPPHLFEKDLLGQISLTGNVRRMPLKTERREERSWYEVHATRIGNDTLYAAVNVDSAVKAETQLREFTQTLTKTFAHLTVGLAIFDRSRRLVLFNPALTDLTQLPVDFLTTRPTLLGFLDKLRDRRIIPEPKDYTTWRRQMAELEAAAVDGSYAETWSLPTGETYRVTGRPHPDGAIIFLFEDISAEISLTRRFRTELETGQAVIDSLSDAIAVFTASGILAMSNTAYARLWGHDPSTGLADISVAEATSTWIAQTAPTPAWGDLRDFVLRGHDRAEWSADVRMRDGRGLFCRFVPIENGGTLVSFRPLRSGDSAHKDKARQSA